MFSRLCVTLHASEASDRCFYCLRERDLRGRARAWSRVTSHSLFHHPPAMLCDHQSSAWRHRRVGTALILRHCIPRIKARRALIPSPASLLLPFPHLLPMPLQPKILPRAELHQQRAAVPPVAAELQKSLDRLFIKILSTSTLDFVKRIKCWWKEFSKTQPEGTVPVEINRDAKMPPLRTLATACMRIYINQSS